MTVGEEREPEQPASPRPVTEPPGMAYRHWLRARYAWAQSPDHRLAAARTWIDTRRFTAVASASGPATPSIGYVGPADGVIRIHQFLQERQEALAATQRGPVAVTALARAAAVAEPATVDDGEPEGAAGADARTQAGLGRRPRTVPRGAVLAGRWLPDTDLVAVAGTPAQLCDLPRRAALVLPYRLHLVVDLAGGGEWRARLSRHERKAFAAQARRSGATLAIADDDASFAFFYDRMHTPTMRRRHGARTRGESRDAAHECLFRDGVLAFVTVDGARVAGALCHRDRRRNTLTLRLLGVLDGDQRHYDTGALKVIYHLLLDWADRTGVAHLDFGGTESWLSKGIFRWKRRFGPRAVPPPNHQANLRVWWRARRDTPPVRDFLVANPAFEWADQTTLRAVYFHDDERPARLDLAYRCANVEEFRTVHLDQFLAGLPVSRCRRSTT